VARDGFDRGTGRTPSYWRTAGRLFLVTLAVLLAAVAASLVAYVIAGWLA